jgi:hypothetical protein
VSRRAAVLGFAAVLALGLANAVPAQELSVSAAAGGMSPSGGLYRDIYGPSLVIAGDVWLDFRGTFGLTAGFSALSDDGVALGPTDSYEVELSRRTVPVVAYGRFAAGPVTVRAGAGLAFHRVEETWRTVDLGFTGTKTAPRFLLGASVRLAGRLSLVAYATYDPLRLKENPAASSVDAGGVTAVAGIAWRIF